MATFERLWAPWRSAYIRAAANAPVGCVFCRVRRRRNDRVNLVIHRGAHAFVLLNRYPYNVGHLMIAPYRHTARMDRLSPEEGQELFSLAQRMIQALTRLLKPHGFNLGMNLGRLAGAGIPGHLHLHVVPRWRGDTNFMPVIGSTRVMSASLRTLYTRLHGAMAS